MKNSLIIVVETEEVVNKIIELLKKEVLNFYSGKLFLSDVNVVD
jgi:nitrogen regulatory protein PII